MNYDYEYFFILLSACVNFSFSRRFYSRTGILQLYRSSFWYRIDYYNLNLYFIDF